MDPILAVSFAIQLTGLVILGVLAWHTDRHLSAMVAESQRLTKAVAGLVVQEEEKTRALLPHAGR